MKSSVKKNRKGLTLIEVMLVIALLIIALFPILQMFSRGILISSETEESLKALSLAERFIEEEKNTPWSQIETRTKEAVAGHQNFSREITVYQLVSDLKEVTATIYYKVGLEEASVSLKTLIADF